MAVQKCVNIVVFFLKFMDDMDKAFDPDILLAIRWPITDPIISTRDFHLPLFADYKLAPHFDRIRLGPLTPPTAADGEAIMLYC
jgi:hypothetical protein